MHVWILVIKGVRWWLMGLLIRILIIRILLIGYQWGVRILMRWHLIPSTWMPSSWIPSTWIPSSWISSSWISSSHISLIGPIHIIVASMDAISLKVMAFSAHETPMTIIEIMVILLSFSFLLLPPLPLLSFSLLSLLPLNLFSFLFHLSSLPFHLLLMFHFPLLLFSQHQHLIFFLLPPHPLLFLLKSSLLSPYSFLFLSHSHLLFFLGLSISDSLFSLHFSLKSFPHLFFLKSLLFSQSLLFGLSIQFSLQSHLLHFGLLLQFLLFQLLFHFHSLSFHLLLHSYFLLFHLCFNLGHLFLSSLFLFFQLFLQHLCFFLFHFSKHLLFSSFYLFFLSCHHFFLQSLPFFIFFLLKLLKFPNFLSLSFQQFLQLFLFNLCLFLHPQFLHFCLLGCFLILLLLFYQLLLHFYFLCVDFFFSHSFQLLFIGFHLFFFTIQLFLNSCHLLLHFCLFGCQFFLFRFFFSQCSFLFLFHCSQLLKLLSLSLNNAIQFGLLSLHFLLHFSLSFFCGNSSLLGFLLCCGQLICLLLLHLLQFSIQFVFNCLFGRLHILKLGYDSPFFFQLSLQSFILTLLFFKSSVQFSLFTIFLSCQLSKFFLKQSPILFILFSQCCQLCLFFSNHSFELIFFSLQSLCLCPQILLFSSQVSFHLLQSSLLILDFSSFFFNFLQSRSFFFFYLCQCFFFHRCNCSLFFLQLTYLGLSLFKSFIFLFFNSSQSLLFLLLNIRLSLLQGCLFLFLDCSKFLNPLSFFLQFLLMGDFLFLHGSFLSFNLLFPPDFLFLHLLKFLFLSLKFFIQPISFFLFLGYFCLCLLPFQLKLFLLGYPLLLQLLHHLSFPLFSFLLCFLLGLFSPQSSLLFQSFSFLLILLSLLFSFCLNLNDSFLLNFIDLFSHIGIGLSPATPTSYQICHISLLLSDLIIIKIRRNILHFYCNQTQFAIIRWEYIYEQFVYYLQQDQLNEPERSNPGQHSISIELGDQFQRQTNGTFPSEYLFLFTDFPRVHRNG